MKLPISHHERVEGHPHRWHVSFHGRSEPVPVELDPEEYQDVNWDSPVRVMRTHFMA